MSRHLTAALVIVLSSLATWLMVEGVHALVRWKHLDGSIAYRAFRALEARSNGPARSSFDPPYTRLVTREMLDGLLPQLEALDAGIGNSPYKELVTPAAAVNERVGGCLTQKPNVRKVMTYLRTNVFNPLDPPALFFDAAREPDPEIEALIRDYGVRVTTHSTNASGERTTLPSVDAERVVLVAGDSVANGSMVDDGETLASRLQQLDPGHRYVNLGIGNASASDVLCALERARERYARRIAALIYVYCENDFDPADPHGTPDAVVDWLDEFAEREDIADVTVVYAPYVYNIVPQLTRFRGYRGGRAPTFAQERARLAGRVRQSGFRYVDIAEVALAEAARRGTQFAALSLFVDHVHLSPHGTRLLARVLAGVPGKTELAGRDAAPRPSAAQRRPAGVPDVAER